MNVKPFSDDEALVRAVRDKNQRPNFWKKGNRLSSAAFKDENGLSVTRTYDQSLEQTVQWMRDRFAGVMVSVTVPMCRNVKAHLVHLPSESNERHSEIHGSKKVKVLDSKQTKELASNCKIHFK